MHVTARTKALLRTSTARRQRRGFTLIESALATVIVGVGVLAMVQAQVAFHRENAWSSNASIAMRLGNEIREMTLNLPQHDPVTGEAFWGFEANEPSIEDFDDLDDFDGEAAFPPCDGLIFSAALGNGPLNARREVITNMTGWAQVVSVKNVETSDMTTVVADNGSTMRKVDVIVTYQGPSDPDPQVMTRVSWISPK